ncbi:MAG: LacI family DNA-binding transcriptional regulator [Bacteroidota bacterium]
MKHATINDIAKKLNISSSTVSRALSDHPDINKETKLKVKQLAEELNYIPNPIARSLKKNRTSVIGVIVPEIKHDFFSSAISGIEEVAYQSGYTIIVSQSNESYEREIINAGAMINQRVAGLIVSISQNTTDGHHFQKYIDRKIPLVFFDRVCNEINTCKVIVDDEKSAFDAVQFLIGKGYKKIAHFAGPDALTICKKRLNGYKEALQQNGINISEDFIRSGGLHESDGYNSMNYLLEKNLIPDAIFAVNDPVAIGAYQRIKEAGLKIPDNIAIVGFSNNKITSLVDPPLTTIEQPSFEMGETSAKMLIKMIESDELNTDTIILDTKLIVRKSA